MNKENTSIRLKKIMSTRNLRQVDILELCKPYCEKFGIKLGRNDLSQYVSGKVEPGQKKLTVLGMALNVSEVWLMGFNVPMERNDYEDLTLLRSDAELEDAQEIIESAGYKISFSDDSDDDIIVKTSTGEIVACMHDYELVNKYESLQRKGASITADALLENEEVTDFFNKMNAFEMQLKSLGWTYKPMGCHAIGQSIEFELELDNGGNFINPEESNALGCNEKKCENCTERESYYLFTNGEISFKVSIDDYDSFINDGEAFFKERLQQLLKKSMKQMFIDNSIDNKTHLEPQAAHERTDIEVTDEMRKHDNDIMDNDDFWK